MRTPVKLGGVLVALLALVAVGCVPPQPPAPPPPDPVPPMGIVRDLAVGTHQFGFTDSTRSVPSLGAFPGAPVRTIPTSVWYPAVGASSSVTADRPPDTAHGPYPLVVFAHGYAVTPAFYAALLQRIASAGYVVVAPTYPILSGIPAGPNDDVDWDAKFPDTQFVTTAVLDRSTGGDPILGGMIDASRIAVAGHSDGALISFGDGFEAGRTDARVRAVISYAADLRGSTSYQANGRAFLHFASDSDEYNDYDATVAWDHANLGAPSWTVALWGAGHAPPYTNPADPHFDLVVRSTVDFLDAQLKSQPLDAFTNDVNGSPLLGSFV